MELVLESTENVPAGGVLSLKVGDTRRQAPLSKIGQVFKYTSSPTAPLPINAEVLIPAGASSIMIDPTQPKFIIELPGNMKLRMRHQAVEDLARPIPDVNQVAADRGLDGEKKEMAGKAAGYLEKNGLVRTFQDILHGLLVSQPEDPWAYMFEHLNRAKKVATGQSYEQIPSSQAARSAPAPPPGAAAPPPPPPPAPVPKNKSRGNVQAGSKVDALMTMLKKTQQNLPLIMPYLPEAMSEMLDSKEFGEECERQFRDLDTNNTGVLEPELLVPVLVQMSSASEEKLTASCVNKFVTFFDANGDGTICLDEFTSLTQFVIIAAHMESEDGQMLMEHLTHQESHFNEFLDMLMENKERIADIVPFLPDYLVEMLSSEEYINGCMDQFDALDTDKSESLSPDELVPVVLQLSNLNPASLNMDKIQQFVAVFDVYKNGVIVREEFVEFSQFLVVMNFLQENMEGQQIAEAAQYDAELRHCDTLMEMLQSDVSLLPEVMSHLPRSILNEIISDKFKQECEDGFNDLDKDGNKVLDACELYPLIIHLCEGHPIDVDEESCNTFCNFFDADKNGTICTEEFKTICQYVVTMGYLKFTNDWRKEGVAHDSKRIEMMLTEMKEHCERLDDVIPMLPDEVQDELMSMEFIDGCMSYFDELDTNKSGVLEPSNLVPVFIDLTKSHPFALTQDQVLKFVDIFDTERTGVISRNEFINAVRFMMIMGYLETEQGQCIKEVADISKGEKKVEELLAMMERDREAIYKIIPLLPEAVFAELTSDDFVAQCTDRFDELDADKNGTLEPAEIFPLIIELSQAHPYSIDLAQCERFTAIFDLRGDGVIRIDEFLDFARFLSIMSYIDSQEGRQEFAEGMQIMEDSKQIEELITMLESDRNSLRMVIPYLPQDLQHCLLSDRFTKSCLERFKELDTDKSGSLEPAELFPVVVEMLETETTVDSSALDISQVERFTAIFDDEGTGVISQKEFVNFARFVMVMSFLKTGEGQLCIEMALEERAIAAEMEEEVQKRPSAPNSPSRPSAPSVPTSPVAVGHMSVDLEYYQQKADRLASENNDQRKRMLDMEERMRMMDERMEMQDQKLRHAVVDLNASR